MEVNANQFVPTICRVAALTQLMASGGPFNAVTLRLYKNAITPSPEMTIDQLEEADFDGYAPVAGEVFSAAYRDTDGTAAALGAGHVFLCDGDTIPNNIYGAYLTNAGGTFLSAVFPFAAPVGVATEGDTVPVVPLLRYSGV